jgi:hypothetical protein
MGIFNRFWRPWKGTNRDGLARIVGSVLIGSAGAVTSYDLPGATVTLVSGKTGRYRIQLVDTDGTTATTSSQPTATDGTTAVTPWGIQGINAMYVSPTADSAINIAVGSQCVLRNFTPLSGYFDLQCIRSDTGADANPDSTAQLIISFDVKLSNVTP